LGLTKNQLVKFKAKVNIKNQLKAKNIDKMHKKNKYIRIILAICFLK
jgi:hypothetical protein